MIGLRPPRVEHRERGCSSTVEMQCAIFSATRHWAILQGPAGVVNASRRPSEATTTGHAPKYRKFTAGGLLQGFSAGKGDFTPGNLQTSDFFGVNIGTCRWEVPYFYLENSDVWTFPGGHFPCILPHLEDVFQQIWPLNALILTFEIGKIGTQTWQNSKILRFFYAGIDAGHCQNF